MSSRSFSPANLSRGRVGSKGRLGRGLPRTASGFLRVLTLLAVDGHDRRLRLGDGVGDHRFQGRDNIDRRDLRRRRRSLGRWVGPDHRQACQREEQSHRYILGARGGDSPSHHFRFVAWGQPKNELPVASCQCGTQATGRAVLLHRCTGNWPLATGNSQTVDSLPARPDSRSTGAMRAAGSGGRDAWRFLPGSRSLQV